jgi:hypothetical protein
MTARSHIKTRLAPEVRRELDRRIIDGGFGTTADLAAWLEARAGLSVSQSAMHRYIQGVEAEYYEARQAFSITSRANPSTLDDAALLRELGELRLWKSQIDQRAAALITALEARHAAKAGAAP